jgi:hypothetical protein
VFEEIFLAQGKLVYSVGDSFRCIVPCFSGEWEDLMKNYSVMMRAFCRLNQNLVVWQPLDLCPPRHEQECSSYRIMMLVLFNDLSPGGLLMESFGRTVPPP